MERCHSNTPSLHHSTTPSHQSPLHPSEAAVHDQHGENEHTIQTAVTDELPHGLDRVQLRVKDGFHTQAHSQLLQPVPYCRTRSSQFRESGRFGLETAGNGLLWRSARAQRHYARESRGVNARGPAQFAWNPALRCYTPRCRWLQQLRRRVLPLLLGRRGSGRGGRSMVGWQRHPGIDRGDLRGSPARTARQRLECAEPAPAFGLRE